MPDTISIENLLSGNYTSKSRNKLIAKAFKEAGLIERYGSGIMRVCRICREHGIKEPIFKEIQQGFVVVLYKEKATVNEYVTNIITGKVGEKVVENLNTNQQIILDKITKNPYITASDISKQIRISSRKIQENIAKLKEMNLLKRIGPAKGGHWEIIEKKYNYSQS